VGGTDQKDTHWPIANHGEFVDIVAPAVVYTTERRGGYGFEAGTSLSTPFVSGVAGLIKSLRPDLTAPEIIEILETQAADLGDPGWDPYYGWGRLDAHKALVAANYGQDIPVPLYLPYINPGD
jgi:subtilisin family serine protease